MLYILRTTYTPNTASSNRALAYYKAIDKMGIPATIVLLRPDTKRSEIGYTFKNIKVNYWYGHKSSSRITDSINYYRNIWKFVSSLKKGDKVYVYGSTPCLHMLLNKSGVEVYLEVTEHPLVYPVKTRLWRNSLSASLNDIKKVQGLFVISQFLKSYFVQEGITEAKIHVINMTVDVSRFENIEKDSDKRYICYCGNGNNKKDKVDELIKVFHRVAANHPDICLYIVGPKQQVYKDEKDNVELVKELGLEDRVVFTGMMAANEIPQVLLNAELLALDRPDTLQNKAGFPTKLGEYLLSGNPVVATTVGDLPLFLKDGENALLVTPGDSEGFAQKIAWTIEHPQQSKIIGRNGKQVALKYFNADIETRKLISVILG